MKLQDLLQSLLLTAILVNNTHDFLKYMQNIFPNTILYTVEQNTSFSLFRQGTDVCTCNTISNFTENCYNPTFTSLNSVTSYVNTDSTFML